MILQQQVTLDKACLEGIKTSPDGCNFRLVKWRDRLFLEFGCYGVQVNCQGYEQLLMNFLEDGSDPFRDMADILFRRGDRLRLLDISPETMVELLARRPCVRCGGTRLYPSDAKLPEYVTQADELKRLVTF